jgi:hypothetical protein
VSKSILIGGTNPDQDVGKADTSYEKVQQDSEIVRFELMFNWDDIAFDTTSSIKFSTV